MDRFLSVQAFVVVAERKSFANAARQLGVSPSVVSSRVRQLEKAIRAPLFHRSTRKVVLSDTGKACLKECEEVVDQLEAITDCAQSIHGTPTGELRLQVLPGFALGHLGRAIKSFHDTHPGMRIDITVSDVPMNPVTGGFDVSLQIFRPSTETLIQRPLFTVRRIFCASADYLRRHGEPRHPNDLTQHTLSLYSAYPTRNRWTFSHEGLREVSLQLTSEIRSNSVHLLRDFALSGGGITCLPTLVCSEDLLNGSLVPVLPMWKLPPWELLAVYPATQRRVVKVRLFVEFIAKRFAGELEWDRALQLVEKKRARLSPQRST